jgi:hypothetical protein
VNCGNRTLYDSFAPALRTDATANGSAIGNSSPVQINMVDNSGRLKDQTSALSGGGNFSDTWLRAN